VVSFIGISKLLTKFKKTEPKTTLVLDKDIVEIEKEVKELIFICTFS